jgi:hypothetical protein
VTAQPTLEDAKRAARELEAKLSALLQDYQLVSGLTPDSVILQRDLSGAIARVHVCVSL